MVSPILFYDGSCGLCASSVQFVLRHEGRHHSLRFASLDSPRGRALRKRLALERVDSLVWYEPGSTPHQDVVRVRSDAALALATYLGGGWRVLSGLGHLVPRPIRDAVYDLVARHRHALGGRQCLIPSPATLDRFLDLEPR